MTPEQERHLKSISDAVTKRMAAKYAGGAREHGGNLWEHHVLWFVDQAIDENIDSLVYLFSLRDELQKMTVNS
jgi:hypothetical protein